MTTSPSSHTATGWPLTIDDTPSEAAISIAVSNWRSERYDVDLGVDDDGEVRPAVVDVVADHQRARCAPSTSSGCGGGRRRARTRAGRGRRRRRPARRPTSALRGPWRSRPAAAPRAVDPRVHPQRLRAGLHDLPAHQAEQVGLDDQRRADLDDTAARASAAGTPPRSSGPVRAAARRGAAAGRRRAPRSCATTIGVRRGLVTRMTATALSPTVTRSGSSVRSTSRASRPMTNGRATSEHDQAAGGDDHQLDPAEQPPADVGDDTEDGDGPTARRQRDAPARCDPSIECWRPAYGVASGASGARRRGARRASSEPRRRGRWCRPCPARPPA